MPTKVHREPEMTENSRSSKNYITTRHNQGADSQSSSPCCPNVFTSPRLGRPPWYTVTVGSVVWLFGRASRDARSSWHTLHYGHMDECRTFRYTMIQAFLLCSALSLLLSQPLWCVSSVYKYITPFLFRSLAFLSFLSHGRCLLSVFLFIRFTLLCS